MKKKILSVLILLALLLIPTSAARAQSPDNGDVVRIGEDYTLESGETLSGSLIVIGGSATIEEDAEVTGDIVVIGGNLSTAGETGGNVVIIGGSGSVSNKSDGDVVAIGGQIVLTETADVKGNVVTLGGQVTQEEGAQVAGDVINSAPPVDVPNVPEVPDIPAIPNVPNPPSVQESAATAASDMLNPVWQVVGVLMPAFVIAMIAMLLTLFLQPQMDRVAGTIMAQPLLAGSFGLMAFVLAPLASVVMVLTLILIPVAVVFVSILPIIWLFGIISFGQEIGERFTNAIHQTWSPVLSTGFGTFMLMVILGFVNMVSCVGWLVVFAVSLVAFGGVLMTWFNSRGIPAKPAPVEVTQIPPAS